MKNYYKILGIEKSATTDEVKKAFRKLATEFHPDINKASNAKDKFIEIYEAYEILVDASKREKYDDLFFGYSQEREQEETHFKSETKKARQNGRKYSNWGFLEFSTEFLANISLEFGMEVVFEGVGKIMEITGEAIGEIISGAAS